MTAAELSAWATDVAWAFGLKDASSARLVFEPPRDAKAAARLLARLGPALDEVRPASGAPSVGEVIGALYWSTAHPDARPAWPPFARALRPGARAQRRAFAELEELVAQGTHGRAKRQERPRVLAELVVLFDLEPSLGLQPTTDLDAVARAIASLLRARS